MTITELASSLGTTVRALRYYEEAGLLTPQRTSGNARVYGLGLQSRARVIVELRSADVPVEDIRLLLEKDAHPLSADVVRLLQARLIEIDRQAANIRAILKSAIANENTGPPLTRPLRHSWA